MSEQLRHFGLRSAPVWKWLALYGVKNTLGVGLLPGSHRAAGGTAFKVRRAGLHKSGVSLATAGGKETGTS